MNRLLVSLVAATVVVSLAVVGCAQAPAAPAKGAEPSKAAVAPPTAAPAQKVSFPEKGKAITLIVPWAAGGAADIAARVLAPLMEKELGTPVQVVNKEGAGSQVGLTELARAKPDGYTVLAITIPTALTTYLDPERKAVYTRESFQPIAGYVTDPYALVVKSDSPYKSLKDLMDAAKANPEKIKVSSSGGRLSASHLSILLLEKATDAKFATVFFEGVGQALTALLGGHVDASIGSVGGYTARVKGGEVRILGITDKEESPLFPGAKTMESQGYQIRFAANMALTAPAGTPGEVVAVLSTAVKKALDTGELEKRMAAAGSVARYMDAAGFATLWTDLEAQVKPLVSLARQ